MTRQVCERPERGRVAVPEAPARAPHVPVRELVDERLDRVAGARGVVVVEPLADGRHRRRQARERPAVEVGRRPGELRHVVDVRVQDVEAVRVPQLEQELAHRLADRLGREQVAVPRLLGGQEVPAERVGAVLVDDLPRRDDVPQRLRHLLALGIRDVPEDEHRLVGRLVEQQRRDREQRVEPAARLVDRLADVVGREALLEDVLVLERRVVLGERHAAGVEPHVDDLGDALHRLAAVGAVPRRRVDERPVRILEHVARLLRQLGQRPDALGVAVRAPPDRQRRAPVALARDRPVDVVLQPAPHAAVLDVLGVPVDRLVGGEQAVAQLRRADEPRRLGVVEERRPATPAVRVGVQVRLGAQQPPARAQVLDDVGVGLLHPAPGVGAHAVDVRAVEPHRVDDVDALLLAEPVVVLAEGDRRVHDAGAVVGADEVAGQHGVALRPELLGLDEVERGLVARAEDLGALEALR